MVDFDAFINKSKRCFASWTHPTQKPLSSWPYPSIDNSWYTKIEFGKPFVFDHSKAHFIAYIKFWNLTTFSFSGHRNIFSHSSIFLELYPKNCITILFTVFWLMFIFFAILHDNFGSRLVHFTITLLFLEMLTILFVLNTWSASIMAKLFKAFYNIRRSLQRLFA